ncbi:MAG: cytochrome o ubiquinol oxidase subunit IV [Candidatus Saccharimonadales bacterium]
MTENRYTFGYLISLVLTLTAYNLVVYQSVNQWLLVILLVLAVAQMIVQLVFFLHLGEEVKPRYKLVSFVFMSGILLIVVAGSLWIMANLDNNMMHMTPQEKTDYMMTQHDKGF